VEEDAQEVGVRQDLVVVDHSEVDLALGREVHIEVVGIELQALLQHAPLQWHLHHLVINNQVSQLGKLGSQCSKLEGWAQR
jgi:hypothetical protein